MKIHKQFLQLSTTSLLLLLLVIYALYDHSFEMAFAGSLMLVVSLAPFYLKAAHNVYIPAVFMYAAVAFIFSSLFLGEFVGLYHRWNWYDSLLHFISALALGLVGFLILFVYYVHNKLRLPKALILFFTFFFCLGVGALWEIIEYVIDLTFGTEMQLNSLNDTMIDLILDGLGAGAAVILCFIYMSKTSVPVIDKAVHAMTNEVVEENKEVAKTTINDPGASSNPR